MIGQYIFDPFWPSGVVVLVGMITFVGGVAGLIGGIATSGRSYPEAHLDANFPTLTTASPARRLGGSLLDGLIMVFTLFIGWLIWFVIVAPRGQTPGKSLVSTYVMRADGTRAGGGLMWLREAAVKWLLMSIVDVFLLGLAQLSSSLWCLWDPDKQCLWDKIVGSYVAYAPQRAPGDEPMTSASTAERLRELQGLHTDGVITADEYEERRRRLIGEL